MMQAEKNCLDCFETSPLPIRLKSEKESSEVLGESAPNGGTDRLLLVPMTATPAQLPALRALEATANRNAYLDSQSGGSANVLPAAFVAQRHVVNPDAA